MKLSSALLLAALVAPHFLTAQDPSLAGPWKAERSKRGDTTVVRTMSGSVWGEKAALVEDLRIGTKEGDGPDSFGFIQAFALFRDGVVAAFDGSVPALRLFDSAGKHLRTLGRDGAGPGEYRNQTLGLAVDRDGELLMYDPRNARINRYKEDGTVLPSWPVLSTLFTSQSLQVDTVGNTYVKVTTASAEDMAARRDWRISLARHDASGVLRDTLPIPNIPGDVPLMGTFFDPAKYWHLNRRGETVSGFSGVYAITVSAKGGAITRIERNTARVQVQAEERRNYQAVADARRTDPMVRPQPPAATVPGEKPYFRSIQSDLDGRIWVDLYTKSEAFEPPPPRPGPPGATQAPPIRWRQQQQAHDVFQRDGTYLGRLTLPRRTTLSEAKGNLIWAIQRGDDDEQYIVRYRISGTR